MFAKINHVAIVSEKYALITKFYEAVFGMYQSKTSPKSALTVGDGYVGLNINPRKAGRPAGLDHFGIQVEDVETAVELVGMGLVDSVIPRGAAEQLLPRLAPDAGWVSLRPRQFDTLAIVHRAGATLSPAARLMIDLATKRIQEIAEPVHPR